MKWIPVILIIFNDGQPNKEIEGVYKEGFDTYLECKQTTIEPEFRQVVRILYKDSVALIKTDCKQHWPNEVTT